MMRQTSINRLIKMASSFLFRLTRGALSYLLTKLVEAFHIFAAIYAENFPHEIGNFMTYAHTGQKIADSCGDSAALMYDEKFRRWREKEPSLCDWEKKNIELYQEALVIGLDFTVKYKKQPFRAQSKSHNYCYSFNNVGSCTTNNCPINMFASTVRESIRVDSVPIDQNKPLQNKINGQFVDLN